MCIPPQVLTQMHRNVTPCWIVLVGWRQVFFVVQFMGETEQTQANKDAFVQAASTNINTVFSTSPILQTYGSISSEVQSQPDHPTRP